MGTGELSVFGLGSSLDITLCTLALTGVIGFTVLFEMGAHRLEHILAGTPYMGMLAKIYKELMIMGVISLGVFLALELGSVNESVEFYAFEFAHILIFFTALIFVLQACLMMVFSAKLKRQYERSTRTSVDHLLSIFSLHRRSKMFHARWLPWSNLREMMEFKIVHAFFRTTFALPTSFDFALYMRQASDSHILSLVDVEVSTWLVLALLSFVNLGRVKVWQILVPVQRRSTQDDGDDDHHYTVDDESSERTTSHHESDDYRRWLASVASEGNGSSDGELVFIVLGWGLLGVAVANYLVSRHSEIRLLKKAGCESTHDYHTRLCVIEKQFLVAKRAEEERKGSVDNHLQQLRVQVNKVKGHHTSHRRRQKWGGEKDGEILHRSISHHIKKAKKSAKAATTSLRSVELRRSLTTSFRRTMSTSRILPRDVAMRGLGDQPRKRKEQPDVPDVTIRPTGGLPLPSCTTGAEPDTDRRTALMSRRRSVPVCASEAPAGKCWSGPGDSNNVGENRARRKRPHRQEELGTGEESLGSPTQVSGESVTSGTAEEETSFQEQEEPQSVSERRLEGERKGENRYLMQVPTLLENEGDIDAKSRSGQPSSFLVRISPVESVDEQAEITEAEDGDGDDDYMERTVEGGQHEAMLDSNLSVGKRASISFHRKARRLSVSARRVTTKLASDVNKLAKRVAHIQDAPKLKLYNDISDIYPFSSPTLFHKSLDALLLFSCTYLALWAVNFLTLINEKPYSFVRHAGILLPAAGVFIFNFMSVKTSSLLLAISAMDPDIIGKVLDEQIDESKLVAQFRERLKRRLDELGLGIGGLGAVFEEMDVMGRGELTMKELSNALFKLNIHASQKKYRKLFNVMDKNRLGVVGYKHLFELIFDREAAAQEERALKMRGKLHAIK